jgi:uncharacterized protein YndB with AHSA1/START domain
MTMAATSTGTAVTTTPDDTTIHVVREFDAPRHLVYRAWTTPELVKRWWSGLRGEVTSAEIDLQVGGRWRYVMMTGEGFEVAFHGEFREIVPNERIVNTEVYEGVPNGDDDPAVVTNVFTEVDGRTTLTMITEVSSREVRDLIIGSGMEVGMQESLDALEQVAVSLR